MVTRKNMVEKFPALWKRREVKKPQRKMYDDNFLYPSKTNNFGGILESTCLYVCPCVCVSVCVQTTSFCQSTGGGISSHFVTALGFLKSVSYGISVLTTPGNSRTLNNSVGKKENVDNRHFLLSSQSFYLFTEKRHDLSNNGANACNLSKSEPFPKQVLVFTCLQYKSFENTEGKGEIAHNEQFLFFPLCFLPFKITFYRFHQF